MIPSSYVFIYLLFLSSFFYICPALQEGHVLPLEWFRLWLFSCQVEPRMSGRMEGIVYLFLAEDEHSARLDGVPGGQALPWASLHAVLVSLPHTIPCGPGNAQVMPLAVCYGERQGHSLRAEKERDKEGETES